jgi:hypothetical protein
MKVYHRIPSVRIAEGIHVVRLNRVFATLNEVFDLKWDQATAFFYASGL